MNAPPSTRVWRQLRTEAAAADSDAVLRLALAAMAADPTSALTTTQRIWIIDLAHRTTRFTAAERAKLQAPLLEWVDKAMPRCRDIVRKQFHHTEEA